MLVGALVMWLVDDENFPNYGVALWWSAQTVTTVGYGDVVPTNVAAAASSRPWSCSPGSP